MRPSLKLVEVDTGEVHECPGCDEKDHLISQLERKIVGLSRELTLLTRDLDAEAREHDLWPEAVALFEEWKRECRHPKARWDAKRFWVVEPFLSKHGVALCRQAVAGAAFDPYRTNRRNGTAKRHDGWELIFKDQGKFEDFCNRAPRRAS